MGGLRKYAHDHGLTEPSMTKVQLAQFAQDEDAFKQWATRVKATFKNESNEEDDVSTSSDDDDDDEEE